MSRTTELKIYIGMAVALFIVQVAFIALARSTGNGLLMGMAMINAIIAVAWYCDACMKLSECRASMRRHPAGSGL